MNNNIKLVFLKLILNVKEQTMKSMKLEDLKSFHANFIFYFYQTYTLVM